MKNLKIWSLALALLVAMVGCETAGDKEVDNGGSKAPFKPVATTELASKIVNKWELVEYAGQPAEFEIFIDFAEGNTYELYERAYGHEYEYRTGTYTLEGDMLEGLYHDGSAWNNKYQVQIAETPYLRLRLIEEGGQYAEYKQVESVPERIEALVPAWDGSFRVVPTVAASGYIEITHPAQFATLLSETDAEAFVAAGKRVRIMKDLYFNNIALKPVADKEYFRDFELDGNGHTLYDLNIECEQKNAVAALFPEVVDATFTNLAIKGIKVDAGKGENAYAGALVGVSYGDLVVDNVLVKDATVKGTNKVGGLVGFVAQNSISINKSGVIDSTVETYDVANESGLAGGLIGYISCTEEAQLSAASYVTDCYVRNTTLNVINSRGNADRANSEFIGGIGGDDGDIIYIAGAKTENVTLSDTVTVPLHKGVIGGTRDLFTVCLNGVAYYNGHISANIPAAVENVVEIETPSQFAALLTQGAKDLKVVIKNNFDFGGAEIAPKTEDGNPYIFHGLEIDATNSDEAAKTKYYTISNIKVVGSASYSALFPDATDVTIKNIAFEGITVDAGKGAEAYAGILIARAYGATVINNVKISKSTVKGTNKVGGFVGLVAENNITLTKSTIDSTTIETYDVTDESGLAGGLIGYIACAEDTTSIEKSTIDGNSVLTCIFNVINARNDQSRANSIFIGGVDGNNGDVLSIGTLTASKNTFDNAAANGTYTSIYKYVGGRRGLFTIVEDGVAYWNGSASKLPDANVRGIIDITLPSQLVTVLTEGAAGKKFSVKSDMSFLQLGEDGKAVGGTLAPVVDLEKFRAFEFDGGKKTISDFTINGNGAVAALFPEVVDATIKDLTVSNANVDAGEGANAYAAAVVGTSYGKLTLTNVDVMKSTVKGTNKVGALVGFVAENSIAAKNCDVDGATVATHDVDNESGLAGGFIGYIGCQEGSLDKSTIETCTVKNSTLTFINARDNADRANSEFIGGIGGDEGDELAIKGAVVEKNTFASGATNHKEYHKLIGGKRGQFKVTVDGKSIDPVVEDDNNTPGEGTGSGEDNGSNEGAGSGEDNGSNEGTDTEE